MVSVCTIFIENKWKNFGYWHDTMHLLNLPHNSNVLRVVTPIIGSYFEIMDSWLDLVKQLNKQLQNLNIHWKLACYDLFAPVYNGHKLDKKVLPKPRKLCLHFQAPDGPKFYYPHPPSKYAFEAMKGTTLPIITSVKKDLIEDFNISFNFISIFLYFDETCQILSHHDGPQQIDYEIEKEVIITLCVYNRNFFF